MAADQALLELSPEEWASDVGVGVGDPTDTVRLQIAKRTDTAYVPYVWMLRIQRPF